MNTSTIFFAVWMAGGICGYLLAALQFYLWRRWYVRQLSHAELRVAGLEYHFRQGILLSHVWTPAEVEPDVEMHRN